MKYWKYQIVNRTNVGTEENPVWNESLFGKMLPQTEANEEIAKAEAYNGEYEIFDDGTPEPEPTPTPTPTTDYATYEELAEAFSQGVDSI